MATVELLQKINICPLCQNSYDRIFQKPIQICSNHIICQRCFSEMLTGNTCPFCHKIIPFKLFKSNSSDYNKQMKQLKQYKNRQDLIINRQRSDNSKDKVKIGESSNRHKWYQDEVQFDKIKQQQDNESLNEDHRTIQKSKIQIYTITITVQLLFTFCNLYFAIKNTQTQCMDQIHGNLVLRPWMLGIGITQSILIILAILNLAIYCINCIDKPLMTFNQLILMGIFLIKISLWAAIQFNMFQNELLKDCSGSIKVYLYVITLIHILIGILIFLLTGICILEK